MNRRMLRRLVYLLLFAAVATSLASYAQADECDPCAEQSQAVLSSVNHLWDASMGDIVINEIEMNSELDDRSVPYDWVELYNRGNAAVDISGWYVLVLNYLNREPPHIWRASYRIEDTVIQPGEYLIVQGPGNWLTSDVERVYLVAQLTSDTSFLADVAFFLGEVTENPYGQGFRDWDNDNQTWQRSPDGGPARWFLLSETQGCQNAVPSGMTVTFSSIHYEHSKSDGAGEYVELINLSDSEQLLDQWVLRVLHDGVLHDDSLKIEFPSIPLSPGELIRIYFAEAPEGEEGLSLGYELPIIGDLMPSTFVLETKYGREITYTRYWTDFALAFVWLTIDWETVASLEWLQW